MSRTRSFSPIVQLCGVAILLCDIILCAVMLFTGKVRGNYSIGLNDWITDCGGFLDINGVTKAGEYCKSSHSAANADILSKIIGKEMGTKTKKSRTWKKNDKLIDAYPHGIVRGVDVEAGKYADTSHLQTIETWSSPRQRHNNLDFGVTLRHGRLVVPASGVYQIFSHIDFTAINQIERKQAPELEHRLYKFNILRENEGEVEVLQAGLTPCLTNEKWAHEENAGSYAGAIAYLQAGDEIAVRVSHVHSIQKNNQRHYFGLHRLSG